MIKLRYGNTNTFFLSGSQTNLLIDTDYAGTLPAFYREIKRNGIRLSDITFVMATHYHPDHMGLISELMGHGVRLLLIDNQIGSVHFSDAIFQRDKRLRYIPITDQAATVISCSDSRRFLLSLGIHGEIIPTPSHSPDSVSVLLDDGSCFVGDLEPLEYLSAYEENPKLEADWNRILSCHPGTIFYAHVPEQEMTRLDAIPADPAAQPDLPKP